MKAGDIVRSICDEDSRLLGMIIQVFDDLVEPPICKVMLSDNSIQKFYFDELESIK